MAIGPVEEAYTGAIGMVKDVAKVFDKANMYAGRKSLIDVSKHARVEPLMIVDSALMGYEHMYDISQTMQALFSGYYLQAVEMMNTISGIEVAEKLAPLNPNRSPDIALMSYGGTQVNDWRMHSSSYSVQLPTKKNRRSLGLESYAAHYETLPWSISLESKNNGMSVSCVRRESDGGYTWTQQHPDGRERSTYYKRDEFQSTLGMSDEQLKNFDKELDDYMEKTGTEKDLRKENLRMHETNQKLRKKLGEFPDESAIVDKDVTKMITDVSPLSVGKLYEVTFQDGKQVAKIKVAIRLMAKMVPSSTIASICTMDAPGKRDIVERFHGVRSGELEFINHFIFCNDLVEEHRKAAIKDKTGLYKEIMARKNKSMLAGLLERNPSVAVASNLAIVDSNTLENIEGEMGGSIKITRVRDQIFETTSLMILAVVDKGYDRVRFYHRGIDGCSDMSMREVKANTKGDGNQIADIMKAFLKGNAPQL